MPSISVPFLYDDNDIILRNGAFDNPGFWKDLTSHEYFDRFGERTYRPAATLSLYIDWNLWGANPEGYHATNILLNALAGLAVFLLLIRMGISEPWSFFGALVFSLHPVHTEAVALASNREELMCGLFFFLAYYFYLDRSARGKILALLSMLIAILSKEMAAALPVILVAHEIYYSDRDSKFTAVLYGAFRKAFWFIIIAAAPIIFKYIAFTNAKGDADYPGDTLWQTVVIMSDVFMTYCRLALAPIRQCADYVINADHSFAAPAGTLVFSVLAVYLRKFAKTPGFAMAFFGLSLLPVSNIIPFGETMAERYLYIPLFALALALAAMFDKWPSQRLKVIPAVAILAALSFLTISRLAVWQSDFSFWSDTTKCAPRSAEGWLNLGNAYLKSGDPAKALALYSHVPGCETEYEETKLFYNSGLAHEQMGETGKALEMFNRAIEANIEFTDPYFHAGTLLGRAGKVKEGLGYLEKAIEIKDDSAISYYIAAGYIMRYYSGAETNRLAIEYLEKAVVLSPKNALYKGALGQAYYRAGMLGPAEQTLMQSISLDPSLIPSYRLLIDIYRATGREARAKDIEKDLAEIGRPDNK